MAVPGNVVAISHTRDLQAGDLVQVAFAPGHMGYLKYGSEALFRVSRKALDGSVFFSDPASSIMGPLRGTRKELLQELRKLTDFLDLKIIRPRAKKLPPPGEVLDDVGEVEPVPDVSVVPSLPKILPPPAFLVGGALLTGVLIWISQSKKEEE